VQDVDGWGTTSSRVGQTPRSRRSGSWSGDKFASPRAVTVSGFLVAPTPEAAQDAVDRLSAAIDRQDFPLIVEETGAPRWAPVYQTGEVLPVWVGPTEVLWSFQVASDDWRKFGARLEGSTTLPATTGGMTLPATLPLRIDATTITGQVSLTNPGNEPGPVTLRIDGPCAGPVITHAATGAALVFSSTLVLGEGEFLVIDMDARSALANGQASRAGWITSRGWSQFEPGANTWAFTAASYSPSARLSVSATPAWR
jgi:hypothetical protein